MKIKPLGKLIIFMLVVGAALGGLSIYKGKPINEILFPPPKAREAVTPGKIDLPTANQSPTDSAGTGTGGETPVASLPGSEPGCTDKPEVRQLHWAWNAQLGLLYATGGKQAAKGSLMCKYGVNLKLERQDDVGKMQEALVAFATELKRGNPHPRSGCHFVTIMGDGSATFLHDLNANLKKLGPEYQAKVVGTLGYSRGEDKFMGPAAWKTNPMASRGGVVAGYLRDGDWNIAQKWLGDNGLSTNPDEKTYDPDALNWVAANDYMDATEKYISGYTEERPVVRNGRPTGEKKKITVQAVVTWTPGDVAVAQKKGGLVSIVSTKEYSSQMPCTVIGIDKWMRSNRPIVEGYLQAALEGGAAVKKSEQALDKATEIAAVAFNEQGADAAYWKKYYKGVVEKDKTGIDVELGGSSVNDLGDAVLAFGMVPGSSNLFEATYTVFGQLVVSQYPELVPSIQPINEVLDTSYLAAVQKRMTAAKPQETRQQVAQAKPEFKPETRVQRVVSRKAWNITFNTGQATFTAAAQKDLKRLLRDLLVAGNTAVEIHGHTDNTGDPSANMALSEKRAFAVKDWLEKQSRVNFPPGRIRVFAHGQLNPIVPNATAAGQAKNRRVEIIMGTAQ